MNQVGSPEIHLVSILPHVFFITGTLLYTFCCFNSHSGLNRPVSISSIFGLYSESVCPLLLEFGCYIIDPRSSLK